MRSIAQVEDAIDDHYLVIKTLKCSCEKCLPKNCGKDCQIDYVPTAYGGVHANSLCEEMKALHDEYDDIRGRESSILSRKKDNMIDMQRPRLNGGKIVVIRPTKHDSIRDRFVNFTGAASFVNKGLTGLDLVYAWMVHCKVTNAEDIKPGVYTFEFHGKQIEITKAEAKKG